MGEISVRIAIVCNDTRGGVQPYVALARGLARAGHDVRALATEDLASMFDGAGVAVAPLEGSIEAVLRGSDGAAERGALSAMRFAAERMPKYLRAWTRTAYEVCEGVDVITGGIGGMVVALSVAEKLRVPFVEAHLHPVGAPTDAYPGPGFARVPRWLGRWGVLASHHLSELGVWMPFRGAMRAARREVLGLSGRPAAAEGPVLYGFSRHVVPVPRAPGRARHVTGYWTLPAPEGWSPPRALADFLDREGPVVSIGFGSMTSAAPARLTELVQGAARDAGVRAVLLAGWGGLASMSARDEVYCADALPHDWLFARVAAVVHHGGAGTTGAALRAGVPAVVVPFAMDQPFWGARVAALGAGPAPIPRAKLTRDGLAEALRRAVHDGAIRARANALGELIRAEDGVANAVACFDAMG